MADLLEESARRQRRRLEGVARAQARAAGAIGLANLIAFFSLIGVGLVFTNPESRAFYLSPFGQAALVIIISMMLLGRYIVQDMVEDVR